MLKNGILLLEQFELTLGGLVPPAPGVGAGAEIQRPLAIAAIGGLSVSTVVISLLVLPALVRLSWSFRGGEPPH